MYIMLKIEIFLKCRLISFVYRIDFVNHCALITV